MTLTAMYRIFLAISLLFFGVSATPDSSLPVYLRGLDWNKVEEHLKKDLSLSSDVVPTNYGIDLDVNVRGHEAAKRSNFNGTAYIDLKFAKPVNQIELHSNGLIIDKAEMREIVIESVPVGVTKVTIDSERETVTVHVNRTIHPNEEFALKITYRGEAKMDDYGLYESWDPKLNKSLDSNGPFILATNNFPTGARTWFPCFDEPDMKATFDLTVNHPRGLNVSSNSAVHRTESPRDGRTITYFQKSRSMSTYQLALSVNHLGAQLINVNGFGKVRLINTKNGHDKFSTNETWNRIHESTGIPELLKQHLEHVATLNIGRLTKDKLDIIILEGSNAISVQPGIIFVGRYHLWEYDSFYKHYGNPARDLRNLTQLRIGMNVKATNQIWLTQMISHYLVNGTALEDKYRSDNEIIHERILHASLHERPLRDTMMFQTSTKQYLASKNPMPSLRASHLLRALARFCPSSAKALEEYVTARADDFADIDEFIQTVSKSCDEPDFVREFLEDFIDQPGKPLLIVRRTNETVVIEQTRYHSTYFDTSIRDNSTRYTLPVFYTVDGEPGVAVFRKNESSVKLKVNETSLFLIDYTLDHLYFVFYDENTLPNREIDWFEREPLRTALKRSLLTAAAIGFVKYWQISSLANTYTLSHKLFRISDVNSLYDTMWKFIASHLHLEYEEDFEEELEYECVKTGTVTSWDGLINNDTLYWDRPTDTVDVQKHMFCMEEYFNGTLYENFLKTNFLGDTTVIREHLLPALVDRFARNQWRELHRFFFRTAADVANHRVAMLAHTVLNQAKAHWPWDWPYPGLKTCEDYVIELRAFVKRNPRRAAEMATEVSTRLERQYVMEELPKWYAENKERMRLEEKNLRLWAMDNN